MGKLKELLRRRSLLKEGEVFEVNYGEPIFHPDMWMVQTKEVSADYELRTFDSTGFRRLIVDDKVVLSLHPNFDRGEGIITEDVYVYRTPIGKVDRYTVRFLKPGRHTLYIDPALWRGSVTTISNLKVEVFRTPTNLTYMPTALIGAGSDNDGQTRLDCLLETPPTTTSSFSDKYSIIRVPEGLKDVYIQSSGAFAAAQQRIREFKFTPIII